MKAANKTWDEATLDVYLTNPKALVPGTKMAFSGLPSADDRANVIAYLATLK
jgi:cytochrome c